MAAVVPLRRGALCLRTGHHSAKGLRPAASAVI